MTASFLVLVLCTQAPTASATPAPASSAGAGVEGSSAWASDPPLKVRSREKPARPSLAASLRTPTTS